MPVHNGEPFLGRSDRQRARPDARRSRARHRRERLRATDRARRRATRPARCARAASSSTRARSGSSVPATPGCAAARAPLVARQDQDDLSHPRRLERQVAVLDRDPEAVAVGTLCDGHRRRRAARTPARPLAARRRAARCRRFRTARSACAATPSSGAGGYREGTHQLGGRRPLPAAGPRGPGARAARCAVSLPLPRRLADGVDRPAATTARCSCGAASRSTAAGRLERAARGTATAGEAPRQAGRCAARHARRHAALDRRAESGATRRRRRRRCGCARRGSGPSPAHAARRPAGRDQAA